MATRDKADYSRVAAARLIELPAHTDGRGMLTVMEPPVVPFDVRRVFTIHPAINAARGGHAHKRLEQVIIAACGSFLVRTSEGSETFLLADPRHGLYIPPGVYVEMCGFSGGAVALVLCSELYDPEDYIYE